MLRLAALALSASLQDTVGRPWHGQKNHVFGLVMFRPLLHPDPGTCWLTYCSALARARSVAEACMCFRKQALLCDHLQPCTRQCPSNSCLLLSGAGRCKEAATMPRCLLGSEAASLAGQVNAMCTDSNC